MQCPKCGLVQEDAPECNRCRIIIAKYKGPDASRTKPVAPTADAQQLRSGFPFQLRPSWMVIGVLALFVMGKLFHPAFSPFAYVSLLYLGLALCVGWVAASDQMPWRAWSQHPWAVFWLSFPPALVGLALYGSGLPLMGTLFLVGGGLPMAISAIQGLRVTWQRSRKRGLLIIGAVVAVGVINGARKLSEIGDWGQLEFELFVSLLSAGVYLVTTEVADSFAQQLRARRGQGENGERVGPEPGPSR